MNKLTVLVLLANLSIDCVQSLKTNAYALSELELDVEVSAQEKMKLEQTVSQMAKSQAKNLAEIQSLQKSEQKLNMKVQINNAIT